MGEEEKRNLNNLVINLERDLKLFLLPIIIDEIDVYKSKYKFTSTNNIDLELLNQSCPK